MSGRGSVTVGAAIPSLVRWGLSPDADLVFRLLATFGAHTTADLAKELGLPARRILAAVDELRAVGAIRAGTARGAQRPPTWCPQPSHAVVAGLRRLRQRIAPSNAGSGYRLAPPRLGPGADRRHLATRELARVRMAELVAV